MADRVARVVLQAVVGQYRDAMRSAAKDTEDLGRKTKQNTDKVNASLSTMGRGAMLGGAALLAGFGAAVGASAKFEKQMSGVKAVANATSAEMKALSDAALQAGADTAFSASDAAKAEAELAKAGIAVKDILGGALRGALDLAAAGQLDLADAATIAAQAMNIFKLEGKDVGHIADVLAAGANKSAADVKQLGDALRQGGLVAAQTGLTMEETTGALAAFADNALVGSDAGTSLKTMLQRLNPQSAEAADLMNRLGITAYDASGQFVGMERFAGILQNGLKDLSDEQRIAALNTIFGSDAVRAAAIVYDQGAAGISDYVDAVNDQGAAARMAATQLDNLSGDIEALKGSFETALIQSGSGANGVLREMVQVATAVVNSFNALPKPLQQTAAGLAGVGGAALVLGGAAMVGVGQVAKFKTSLITLGVSAERANRSVGLIGKTAKGLGMATAALAIFEVADAFGRLGEKGSNLPQVTEDIVKFAKQGELSGTALKAFGEDFERLSRLIRESKAKGGTWELDKLFNRDSWRVGQQSVREARRQIDDLDKSLSSLVDQGHGEMAAQIFAQIEGAAKQQGVSTKDLNNAFNDYGDALSNARTQNELAGKPAGALTSKLEDQAKAAQESADALRKQADALRASFDPIFAAQDAIQNQADAQTALNKAIKEHGKNSTEAAKAEQDLLRATVDVAGAVTTLEAGLRDGSVSLRDVNMRLDSFVRAGLISASQARAFKRDLAGVTKESSETSEELDTLNDKKPKPKVDSKSIRDAKAEADRLGRKLEALDGQVTRTKVDIIYNAFGDVPYVQGRGGRLGLPAATGGYVTGPGSGTSDSIPAFLSNGEYVINAEATAKHRALLDLINGGGRLTPMQASTQSQQVTNNYTYNVPVTALPGEPAAASVPRALREATFLVGTR